MRFGLIFDTVKSIGQIRLSVTFGRCRSITQRATTTVCQDSECRRALVRSVHELGTTASASVYVSVLAQRLS